MSSAKSAFDSQKEARGYKATTTQEKSEPNRLSGRRRRRKRTAGDRGTKNASKTPRRRICIYLLFEFFCNSNPDLAKEILKHEFALAN